jgi:hypothetical protein
MMKMNNYSLFDAMDAAERGYRANDYDEGDAHSLRDDVLDEMLGNPGASKLLRKIPRAIQKALERSGVRHKSFDGTPRRQTDYDPFWHTSVKSYNGTAHVNKELGRTPNRIDPFWTGGVVHKAFAGWPDDGFGDLDGDDQDGAVSSAMNIQQNGPRGSWANNY